MYSYIWDSLYEKRKQSLDWRKKNWKRKRLKQQCGKLPHFQPQHWLLVFIFSQVIIIIQAVALVAGINLLSGRPLLFQPQHRLLVLIFTLVDHHYSSRSTGCWYSSSLRQTIIILASALVAGINLHSGITLLFQPQHWLLVFIFTQVDHHYSSRSTGCWYSSSLRQTIIIQAVAPVFLLSSLKCHERLPLKKIRLPFGFYFI